MTVIPIASWRPDQPDLVDPGSSTVRNVLRRTQNSYGPMPSMVAYSGALTARCQGAAGMIDSAGNAFAFAGDASKLYEAQSGSTAWTDVSKSGGYSTAADERWSMAFWTPNLVLAANFADPIQSFTLGTSTNFADLANGKISSLALTAGSGYTNGTYALSVTGGGSGSGFAGTVTVAGGVLSSTAITNNGTGYPQTATIGIPAGAGAGTGGAITPTIATIAPRARYATVIRDFVMAFNIFDSVDGARPTRAHWCGIGSPANWPLAGTPAAAAVQSDFQDINLGDFGWGMGIVGGLGSADGALFFERGVVRVNYVGPPDIFGFYAVEGARGTPAPGSIAQLGSFVIYLGVDDLYAFDGSTSTPLGAEKFCKTFYADVDQSHMDRISAAFDPINKVYFMAYPGPGNNGGNCNRMLAYNWSIGEATLIDSLADIEMIFRSLSFGYTLEGLDAVSTNLDLLPFSLDSRAWTGASLLLSAFDAAHKLNYFTGPNLAATVDTSEAQLIPDSRAFVTGVRPLIDGGTPSVAVGVRDRQIDAVTFGPAVALNILGDCPQLAGGRYHTARLTTLAGDSWNHISGADVLAENVAPDGYR